MKYAVAGAEIIGDDGKIDFADLSGAPSAATCSSIGIGTITNCSAYMGLNVTTSVTAGVITITFSAVNLASIANCAGVCTAPVDCNC